jgi:hypothetical protein
MQVGGARVNKTVNKGTEHFIWPPKKMRLFPVASYHFISFFFQLAESSFPFPSPSPSSALSLGLSLIVDILLSFSLLQTFTNYISACDGGYLKIGSALHLDS